MDSVTNLIGGVFQYSSMNQFDNESQHWYKIQSIFSMLFSFQSTLLFVLIFTFGVILLRFLAGNYAASIMALRALRIGGPIPNHVAFIMDGNRRWARRGGLQSHEGHPEGGEKLIKCLEWCMEIGVKVVTVYAFSIENFKRAQIEIDEIMSLAERKFHALSNQQDVIHSNRVRVRVLGDLSLVPSNLRTIMSRVMTDTMHYTDGPTLNICFAYTARHDIATSIADLVNLTKEGLIKSSDISESAISSCLSTGCAKGATCENCYPDLLVRTSGETRLSDFLLWESGNSFLSFYPTLWPDMTEWDFVKLILQYQRSCRLRSSYPNRTKRIDKDFSPHHSDHMCNTIGVKYMNIVRSRYFDCLSSFNKTT